MGSNEVFDRVNRLIQKTASDPMPEESSGHPTNKELAEQGEDHGEPSEEKTETVDDIGEAGVKKNKKVKKQDPPPAQVSEEASEDYSSSQAMPSESKGHPTDKELQDQPSKAALAQQVLEAGQNLEEKLAGLLDEATSDEPEKEAEEDEETEATSDEPEEEAEEDEETEATSDEPEEEAEEGTEAEKAGYQAAAITAGSIEELDQLEKAAALQQVEEALQVKMHQFKQAGAMAGAGLADLMDSAMAGGAPEAAPTPVEEEVVPLEEILAIIEALQSGKTPETPQEKEVAKAMKEVSGEPEAPEEPEPSDEETKEEEEPAAPEEAAAVKPAALKELAKSLNGASAEEKKEAIRLILENEEGE